MNVNDWTLPCAPDTCAHVVTCTHDPIDFAVMICTFIDVWATDRGIDKVKYAAHIAEMVKGKESAMSRVKSAGYRRTAKLKMRQESVSEDDRQSVCNMRKAFNLPCGNCKYNEYCYKEVHNEYSK